ncbi:hypothetical protein ACOSP7_020740 [Xanthoceras sorbifolium]
MQNVTAALSHAGLESSKLIVGINFTKRNEWTSARSFNRRSLHYIGYDQNPYEQAISIIGKTLSAFDEDNLIPYFGFGDTSTHDQDVFSFYPDERFCNGFEEVLSRYREIVPTLRLAGPTSFATVIEMAMTIVEQSGGYYHVLVIIADGQIIYFQDKNLVTRSVDTRNGQLSPQEQKTIDAIVRASEFPLSIIVVGVGDGPWDMMTEFDDNIPARAFDNFQFVNFTEIMSKYTEPSRKETEFALAAFIIEDFHGLSNAPDRVSLPPPMYNAPSSSSSSKPSRSRSFQQSAPSYFGYDARAPVHSVYDTPVSTAPPSSSLYDNQICPICLTNPKATAFGCGHQTCCECGEDLETCPIWRRYSFNMCCYISTKIQIPYNMNFF